MTQYSFDIEFPIERDGACILLQVVGTYTYDPGNYSGPPENCYPENEEFEYCFKGSWDGELTKEENEYLEESIRNHIHSNLEDDWDEVELDDCEPLDYHDDPNWKSCGID